MIPLQDTQNSKPAPELVIGLIGPVGTDLARVVGALSDSLKRFSYTTSEIRLSTLLRDLGLGDNLDGMQEDQRIDTLMNAGDALRQSMNHGGALALLATQAIRLHRLEAHGKSLSSQSFAESQPHPRTAYVLNSLKHPAEIEMLRRIYGDAFVSIGIYQPRGKRESELMKRIAAKIPNRRPEEFREAAKYLVERDEHTPDNDLGQNVRKAFPMADIFINETNISAIDRTLDILFGSPFRTPNKEESAMFHARAVALRSADLSRQVGAVIADGDGDILAMGCNEVPKAGGGVYWEGDDHDSRDFQAGGDTNAVIKQEMLAEILDELKREGWLSKDRSDAPVSALLKDATEGQRPMFENARISAVLEFGRIVHAEMNALLDAARRGVPMKGMTLFCTTFPCHVCARHVIGAGIDRVVYIEPYPKSMASDMYHGAIVVEGEPGDAHKDAVKFEAFEGVSPNRYADFFARGKRKNRDGSPVDWRPEKASLVGHYQAQQALDMEVMVGAYMHDFSHAAPQLTIEDRLQQMLDRTAKVYSSWRSGRRDLMNITQILGLDPLNASAPAPVKSS